MTPDQLRKVSDMAATGDGAGWGLSPETTGAIAAALLDARRYAAVREYEWKSDTGRGIDVRIRGEFPDIDAAVDSLIEKGGT